MKHKNFESNEYIELYEKTMNLNYKPKTFREWVEKRPVYIYKRLPELLGVTRTMISYLKNEKQKINVYIIMRMAIISRTPALELINDLNIDSILLWEKDLLAHFDKEFTSFLSHSQNNHSHIKELSGISNELSKFIKK